MRTRRTYQNLARAAAAAIGAMALLICAISFPAAVDTYPAAGKGSHRIIIIDTYALTLTLYEDYKPIKRYPVAIGRWNMPTPLGVFRINDKRIPRNTDMGTRFMGISAPWGVYGIHGTSSPGSIGSHASHGCVRMFTKDAEELFKLVYVGTPVIIEGSPYGELGDELKPLKPWSQDTLVRAVQRRLISLGYYHGSADGTYGPATSRALLKFKKDKGLPAADFVDQQTYDALGMILFE